MTAEQPRHEGPVLAVAAFQRGAGAALVHGDRLLAAAEESWFSRRADEDGFPRRAAHACLRAAGMALGDVERVALAEKPLARFERLLATQLAAFPRSARAFAGTMFTWLGDRLWIKGRLAEEFVQPPEHVLFVPRLVAHAAAAAAGAGLHPGEEAAVLVLDDCGEWGTTALAHVRDGRVEMLAELAFPHSLGLVGLALEQFLGRTPGVEPGWFEVLGATGRDRFREAFDALVPATDDGAFRVDTSSFRFAFDGERLAGPGLERLFGRARRPGEPLDVADDPLRGRDADLAASFAALVERRALALARALHARAPTRVLLLAGTAARQRRLATFLAEASPFNDVRVSAAPDASGLAVGAAAWCAGQAVGGAWSLRSAETRMPELAAGQSDAFEALVAGRTVGWLTSGLEIGPESLGHRLLLARADGPAPLRRLLGPLSREGAGQTVRVLVRAEDAPRDADVDRGSRLVMRARGAPRARAALAEAAPGCIEPDGRVWLQAVRADEQPALHGLLGRVAEATGVGRLAATSLRARGAPAALSAEDALEALERADVDAVFVDGVDGTRAALFAALRDEPAHAPTPVVADLGPTRASAATG